MHLPILLPKNIEIKTAIVKTNISSYLLVIFATNNKTGAEISIFRVKNIVFHCQRRTEQNL